MSRKKDGLFRRDGIFAFRYKDTAGIWREKSTGKTEREDAKTFKNDFLNDLKNGTLPTGMAEWRLDEAEKWWHEFRKPRIAENTRNSERYRLQHLRRILGNVLLQTLTNRHLDDYTTKRLEEGISATSINKEILLWSLILKKAKLWRRIKDDYKPLPTKASDIGRALTREELRQLAETAATDKDWEAAFYGSVLAANTGLRGGEIKKLRIGEIDLEHRRLRVRRADTKSDAGARIIELNSDATEAAARLLLRASLLKPPAAKPEHYLMPKHLSRIAHGEHKGERGYDPTQHQEYWDTAWGTLTEKAGMAGLRFHDLRHTFITHMVERGIPLGLIEAMVGHISKRMVLHYTHITTGAARKAVEMLDAEPILVPSLTQPQSAEKQTVYRA